MATDTAHAGIAGTTPRAGFDPVPVPASHDEAIVIAGELAERVRSGAIERDERQLLPVDELEDLRTTGLLTLPIRAVDGGADTSHRTIAAVFRTLAAADPAFAQVPQPHFSFVDTLSRYGGTEVRRTVLGDVLRGARVGNALSERGGRSAFDFTTRLLPDGAGGLVISGVKYYSTGALGADWIGVMALDEDDVPVTVYIPGDAPGLNVGQDWAAFGQRSTVSGTTTLNQVPVNPNFVVRGFIHDDRVATTVGAFAQFLHAAIDVGIARGALEDGVHFTRDRARAWPAAQVERAIDEPLVQALFGRLDTLVEAAEIYLDHAATLLDIERREHTADTVAAARLGVAKAKAFAGEVVLEVTTSILDAGGSSAADARYGLDRHWRNARVHTLHDPNRWKYIHAGRWILGGVVPPLDDHSL